MQGKENVVMETGLERIAAKAQANAKLRFTSIAHHVTKELILKSLYEIPRSSTAGIDGVDVEAARGTFSDWCPGMIEKIHQKGYHPPPVRRVFIPKPGKSEPRPIGVPAITDRSLQKAVATVLTPIYEADFLPCSFGGRPGRSAHQAIATLKEAIHSRKVSWIYEADLKNFFGSLSHEWVMQFVEQRVGDPRMLSLIKRWLKAGVVDRGEFEEVDAGTPQGGPISVLISNIYLHFVLDLWIEKVVRPRMRGEMYYVRYLDDFVLCFQYRDDAMKIAEVLPKRLAKFELLLEPTKTKLIEFGCFAKGRDNMKLETFAFLGFVFHRGLSRKGYPIICFKTEKKRLQRSFMKMKETLQKNRHLPLEKQIWAINAFLAGHYRYYGVSSNVTSLIRIYRFVYRYWRKVLSSRSQNGYLSWDKYAKIMKLYPILKPRIYLSYEQMSRMASL